MSAPLQVQRLDIASDPQLCELSNAIVIELGSDPLPLAYAPTRHDVTRRPQPLELRHAIALELTLGSPQLELRQVIAVSVVGWVRMRARIEYVTHLGELVTVNGEPLWVQIIEEV
jgi:hypothetical protein